MAYSTIVQFFVFAVILMLANNFFHHNEMSTFLKNLIITDSFTMDEIGRYHLLNNKYALELALYNIENERKLDSIKFIPFPNTVKKMGICESINKIYTLCKTSHGQIYGITVIKKGQNTLGVVLTKKKYSPIFSIPVSYGLLLILLTVIGIFLFNFLFIFLSMRKTIANNTQYLLDFIASSQTNNITGYSKIEIDEYKQIADRFVDEHNTMLNLQKEKTYYEIRKNIAEQVAHDIRSPLAAINTAVSNVISISENKRIMIRNAAKRINDIANNLLQSKNTLEDINFSPELIFVVLDNIVSEKRYEYHNTQVNFKLTYTDYGYNCFAKINLDSFKRVLSNLINNSIEAIDFDGSVIISLNCNPTHVEITIEDTGCGIPADILPKVTEQGFSFNKKNGAGFGLSYARQYIEQISGKMFIQSDINLGTKISISLIRAEIPSWFCETLKIQPQSLVIVLDDDPSIHDAWNVRFSQMPAIQITHFYSYSDLSKYTIDHSKNILYLIDYELLDDQKNGLDIIEELKLTDKAILVTSCFEDLALRLRCESIGVKIIPKSNVPYIQIIQLCNNTNKYVLIDDDETMQITWSFAAEEIGKQISTYSSFEAFVSEINTYTKDTVIYIDSDLGNNVKGETCAKYLFDKGFTEIHLATGYSPSQFNDMPWIKSVVGKEPPFI